MRSEKLGEASHDILYLFLALWRDYIVIFVVSFIILGLTVLIWLS